MIRHVLNDTHMTTALVIQTWKEIPFNIRKLYFDGPISFSKIFGVLKFMLIRECFIFFIKQNKHGALHIWSRLIDAKCQLA